MSAPTLRRPRETRAAEPVSTLVARERQQAALADFGRRALASHDDDAAFIEHAVASIADTLGVSHTAYLELSQDGDSVTLRAGVGWRPGVVGEAVIPRTDGSQAAYTISARDPVIIGDLAREKRFLPNRLLIDEGVVSGMSVLVGLPGIAYGKLDAYSTLPRRFNSDDANFLQATASVLALAINRARLDRELATTLGALRTADAGRRQLVADLVNAQELERSRMAAEIHDDAVQIMAAVGMRLHTFRRQLPRSDADDALTRLEVAVGTATGRLRRLLVDLRLPALDAEGLAAGIRMYLEQLQAETSLTYELEDALTSNPAVEIRMVIYRIVQEALSNTRKHARASRVTVRLETIEDGVLVAVDDNGVGIEPDGVAGRATSKDRHVGITVMRERAAQLGGSCNVKRLPSGGTRVLAWLPGELPHTLSDSALPS